MKDLLTKGSIVIVLGTGGVGKTTVTAALGIAGAAENLDTALITVDPARRLRDALGLKRLGGRPTRLSRAHLASAGLAPSLRLSAMMLDVKGAWDMMAERFAPDAATRKRILENPFYERLTAEFAGAEAFAALQQLYDLHETGGFDLKIVDTPPAAHAFEFLEAPARFTRLLDSRAARWIFTPSLSAGRIAVRLASQAARFVVHELERFAGGRVLTSVSDFFAAAAESVDAVVDQLRKTEALMRSDAVRFVMVTTPDADRLAQARELIREMKADGLALSAIVINRFLTERSLRDATRDSAAFEYLDDIEALEREMTGDTGPARVVKSLARHRTATLDAIARVAEFARDLPPGVELAVAPELGVEGMHDLAALKRIAEFIMSGIDVAGILEMVNSRAAHRPRARRTAAQR
ncbi:MAG TPA: ArsA-related P-loop ATPase [Candidatus Binataceae bacterium]|nr:ArsA-related P-loop ATPase [Candidatus Binataceae bacterium]